LAFPHLAFGGSNGHGGKGPDGNESPDLISGKVHPPAAFDFAGELAVHGKQHDVIQRHRGVDR
jgi:hypothetical protein